MRSGSMAVTPARPASAERSGTGTGPAAAGGAELASEIGVFRDGRWCGGGTSLLRATLIVCAALALLAAVVFAVTHFATDTLAGLSSAAAPDTLVPATLVPAARIVPQRFTEPYSNAVTTMEVEDATSTSVSLKDIGISPTTAGVEVHSETPAILQMTSLPDDRINYIDDAENAIEMDIDKVRVGGATTPGLGDGSTTDSGGSRKPAQSADLTAPPGDSHEQPQHQQPQRPPQLQLPDSTNTVEDADGAVNARRPPSGPGVTTGPVIRRVAKHIYGREQGGVHGGHPQQPVAADVLNSNVVKRVLPLPQELDKLDAPPRDAPRDALRARPPLMSHAPKLSSELNLYEGQPLVLPPHWGKRHHHNQAHHQGLPHPPSPLANPIPVGPRFVGPAPGCVPWGWPMANQAPPFGFQWVPRPTMGPLVGQPHPFVWVTHPQQFGPGPQFPSPLQPPRY